MVSADRRTTVLLTGATGGIGQLLEERLGQDYDLVTHGRTPADEHQEETLHTADLDDYDEIRELMDGVDVVVHLAGAASPESGWDAVLTANIVGMRNTLEAAREAGVPRFVFASSNHAMGMYDRHGEWPEIGRAHV